MYKKSILLFVFIFSFQQLRADEGMWLLALLKKQNTEQLKAMGLKIPIEKLTGENDGALSESVIAFGSGCTGSIISNSGLVLTNYHCSYDAIQQYVSTTNPIYKNGYWASNLLQELPVKGLSVTINKRILDISGEVNALLKTGASADGGLKEAQAAVSKKYQQQYPQYRTLIKSYKNNSLFVLFLQLRYDDVRMVGVPPKDVAKFGGETDNWMWPRQSADFAYFRIYANKNGMPAAYAKTNVPLKVKNWLSISTAGYQNGDFAMSMGYPGFSDRKALSFKISEKTTVLNPPMIAARKVAQSIWEDEMHKSPFIKQLYAEKYASLANYYKNAVGMNFWVDKLNIVAQKEKNEQEWLNWAMRDSTGKARYAGILQDMNAETAAKASKRRAQTYFSECFGICDMIRFEQGFGSAFNSYPAERKKRPSVRQDLLNTMRYHYKRFNPEVDKRITKAMFKLLKDSVPAPFLPDIFEKKDLHSPAQIDQYVDDLFGRSVYADSTKLRLWLEIPSVTLGSDPLTELNESIEKKERELRAALRYSAQFFKNEASYEKSMNDFKAGRYYPEADKTIRLSYGTVSDLHIDGITKPYQTTLRSLIDKSDTLNKDFYLNEKLLKIWQKRDFGNYGANGDMPVNFVTNGDVTGGNSGSPMMNAEGKIIGLVFDCNWESMTREFNYEKDLHRVVCVDIRYVLLMTSKFSGADRIINEIEAK